MVDFASAQNVASNTGGLTGIALALELIVVRVVNDGFNATSDPIKRAVVTGGTEHLVTTADLENASSAFGASACLGVDEFCGGEIVGVARVFGIVLRAFDFVAVLTGPHTTQVTLPLGAEKSAAICLCVWARSYESGALGCGTTTGGSSLGIGGRAYANAIIDALFFGGNGASLCFKFGDLGGESCFFIAESILASDKFGDALADGEKRFFLLEHNRLAMFFPILGNEFLREVFHEEFTRKFFVTFHTVGDLIGWIKYDGGVALATGLKPARLAGDWDVG